MVCPHCGAQVSGRFCEYCGSEMPQEKTVKNVNTSKRTVINNYYMDAPRPTNQNYNYNANAKYTPSHPKVKMSKEHKSMLITILWLIFFYPVGIVRIWTKKHFSKLVNITITVFFAIITLAIWSAPNSSESTGSANPNATYIASPSPSPTVTPLPTIVPSPDSYESLEDAFKSGFEDGLGDSADERIEDIEENIDSIKKSIKYIMSD
jgi:hypothetical protein